MLPCGTSLNTDVQYDRGWKDAAAHYDLPGLLWNEWHIPQCTESFIQTLLFVNTGVFRPVHMSR